MTDYNNQIDQDKQFYKRTCLVLEGGGFRGIFTAGILEVFLKQKLFFQAVYGVSAGATYGVSYISEQAGRNLAVNALIGDKRYCSIKNLVLQGTLFSWDFILEEVPQQIIPFDYETLKHSDTKFYVGVSNCKTGTPEFFRLNDFDKKDFRTILAASCSLPLIAPMVDFQGMKLLDGGLSDSIPFDFAMNSGYEKAVVILTQPKGYRKEPLRQSGFFKWYYRHYPKVFEMLVTRSDRYNASIDQLEQLEQEGKVYLIRPTEKLAVSRLENNPEKTAQVYHQAMELAMYEMKKLQLWLNGS